MGSVNISASLKRKVGRRAWKCSPLNTPKATKSIYPSHKLIYSLDIKVWANSAPVYIHSEVGSGEMIARMPKKVLMISPFNSSKHKHLGKLNAVYHANPTPHSKQNSKLPFPIPKPKTSLPLPLNSKQIWKNLNLWTVYSVVMSASEKPK